ncbi:MAG: efflux RND transporter periplasmic adaptor subunit [Pseudomonadota bacterium]
MDETQDERPRYGRKRFCLVGVASVVVALAVVMGLLWVKEHRLAREEKARKDAARKGPTVRVVTVLEAPKSRPVTLTGEARPYATATLYAKISGYLQEIYVDKGDHVKQGQVLAKIDSPELNRDYLAGLADAKNKRAEAQRAQHLLETGAISPQNAETTQTAAEVAEEHALALRVQKNYQLIKAPFSGTITARYADPGALLQAATGAQTTALPVVTLSQTDRLRVYAYPDQKTASLVTVGDRVEVTDVTRPEVKLSATVDRTSGELDPKTRTLLVESDLDNREGKIVPGSFVRVTLFVRSDAVAQIPQGCLVMREDKPWVVVLKDNDTVTFRPVDIGESDGLTLPITSGVTPGQRLILNPGSTLSEGEHVQPLEAQEYGANTPAGNRRSAK